MYLQPVRARDQKTTKTNKTPAHQTIHMGYA